MNSDTGNRERAFNTLYDAHYAAVRAYAWRRDRDSADDIVAETFLVAWRRLEDIPGSAQLPWLLGVARNTFLNVHRGERRRRAREMGAAMFAPSAAVDRTELAGEVEPRMLGLLQQLSPRDREILLLVAWEQLDRTAIASVLGCSEANIALRLHRARRKLLTLMEESAALVAFEAVDGSMTTASLLQQGARHE